VILSYQNFGEKRRHRIKARIRTDHSTSSYGQPVIVLDSGQALDLMSWVGLGYRIVRASKKEMADLARMGLI
jgi:hypothetical protein